MTQSKPNKATKTQKVNTIKLSADVHLKDFKICRQVGDQNIQPAQTFTPEAAMAWALKQKEQAHRVVFCYEAGFSGFGLARALAAQGVEPLVMCPQRLDERCRKVNTDRRDVRAIAGRLDRYLAGNSEALVPVRIPSEEEEDERAAGRQRGQMLKARKQFESEGRSLLHYKGLKCPERWWQGSEEQWQQRVQEQGWSASLAELLVGYRRMALAADEQVRMLSQRLEQEAQEHLPAAMPQLPAGFGGLTVELLRREVCDWSRFKNRRQVGSFLGLCAAESSSGDNQQQLSITKRGNPRCRHLLVELAWRALNFQPEHWAVKKLGPRIQQAKPRSLVRKKLIVALARLLAVDLWRLYTGQTTLAKLGLKTAGRTYTVRTA